MKKISLALFLSLFALAGYGASKTPAPTSEIRESGDPDKAAAVEQHASELQAQQQKMESSGSSGSKKSKKSKHKKSSKPSTSGEGAASTESQ